jgi:peptide-methionine (S)-S-oxide reductase
MLMRMKHLTFAVAALAAGAIAMQAQAATKTAVFAGGCFWSVEKFFEATPGVTAAVSGYSGGTSANPTYENHAGHMEAVKVTYDPARITYAQLVDRFYHNIDPTDPRGQICDTGPSYMTAVFAGTAEERAVAEAAKAKYAKQLGAKITVATRNAAPFWNAEGYHQDFAKKNPAHYERYRVGCGRDQALRVVWGAQAGH